MALTKTNVNIFLRAKTAEDLVELQIINNMLNGVHYNYQTPMYDGTNWYCWFFADVKNWTDPNDIDEEGMQFLRGANV